MLVEFRSPRGTAECFNLLARVWEPRNQQVENVQQPVNWSRGLLLTLHCFLCYSLGGWLFFIALKSMKDNNEVVLSSKHVHMALALQGTWESCVTMQIYIFLLSGRWKKPTQQTENHSILSAWNTCSRWETDCAEDRRLICWTATVYLREQLPLQRLGGSTPWPCPGVTSC